MDIRCRLCATFFSNQISILNDVDFCSRIYHLFQVKVIGNDRLPSTVCTGCYSTVDKIWEYSKQVTKAQEILLESVLDVDSAPQDPLDTSSLPTTLQFEDSDIKCVFEIEETTLEAPIEGNSENDVPSYVQVVELSKTDKELDSKETLDEENSDQSETVEELPKKPTPKLKPRQSCNKPKRSSKKKLRLTDFAEFSDAVVVQGDDGSVTTSLAADRWDTYPWTCTDCYAVFESSSHLKGHFVSDHSSAARYMCLDCPKVYSKYVTFIGHVREHRPVLRYCCDICYKFYQTEELLEKHRVDEHKVLDGDYLCNTCGKKFKLQSALLVHLRVHLPVELKNRYPCDQCPKRFGTKPNLTAHRRIHTGIKNFCCDQCGKGFVQKGNLDHHLLTHVSTRPFSCDICGKSFKTQMRLKKHESVHSGLKPYQCDICGKQFRERGTLKEHHRIHTGAMPFSCDFCGKTFRFKGVLTTHRRQHTGERPYSCTECQHHFTNWPNYNKHMKRRHGINTSVNTRTKQEIPPTGMPHRNPPGTVLAPPQQQILGTVGTTATATVEAYTDQHLNFYPVNYEDLMPLQRV